MKSVTRRVLAAFVSLALSQLSTVYGCSRQRGSCAPENATGVVLGLEDRWACDGCSFERRTTLETGVSTWRFHNGVVKSCHAHTTLNGLEPGGRYVISMQVKLAQDLPPKLWHQLELLVNITYKTGPPDLDTVAILPYLREELGWQTLSGDFIVRDEEIMTSTINLSPDRRKLDYLVQNSTIIKLIPDAHWAEKANARIDQIRKSNVTFRINVSEVLDPSKVKIYVNLTKHDFPFGTALNLHVFLSPTRSSNKPTPSDVTLLHKSSIQKYKDFFFFLYGWSVFENALKWQDMEPTKGEVHFNLSDAGLNELTSHGIPVRGHCITWGVPRHNPKWLIPMNGTGVEAEVTRRMDYLLGRYRGRLRHWDVNNEDLHGSFYEEKTSDPDYMTKLFHMAHARDPHAHLFTNDYNVLNGGAYTMAYVSLVRHLVDTGAPIYGMGTQSHLRNVPDITLIQHRLDVESTAGLPIWITELDLTNSNVSQRAQGYEDILRLYFSTPAIEGVVMWGYWDKAHWRPQAALVEGDDFRINEAGKRVIHLYKEEWATHQMLLPVSHYDVTTVRAFHGNYSVHVTYDGQESEAGSFYLHKGRDMVVDVNVKAPI